jgi:hypothetical protein
MSSKRQQKSLAVYLLFKKQKTGSDNGEIKIYLRDMSVEQDNVHIFVANRYLLDKPIIIRKGPSSIKIKYGTKVNFVATETR